jgi:hypothetical protein
MQVTVEISPKWVSIVRSPVYTVVSGLMGVSVTFAPLFLYWSGKGGFYPGYEWFVIPLCIAVIYFVPSFYFALGRVVAEEIRKNPR